MAFRAPTGIAGRPAEISRLGVGKRSKSESRFCRKLSSEQRPTSRTTREKNHVLGNRIRNDRHIFPVVQLWGRAPVSSDRGEPQRTYFDPPTRIACVAPDCSGVFTADMPACPVCGAAKPRNTEVSGQYRFPQPFRSARFQPIPALAGVVPLFGWAQDPQEDK